MRPTLCDFKSPHSRTGEYVRPLCTTYGKRLGFDSSRRVSQAEHSMSMERRFFLTEKKAKMDALLPGPGSNETSHPYKSIESKINSSHHVVRIEALPDIRVVHDTCSWETISQRQHFSHVQRTLDH